MNQPDTSDQTAPAAAGPPAAAPPDTAAPPVDAQPHCSGDLASRLLRSARWQR